MSIFIYVTKWPESVVRAYFDIFYEVRAFTHTLTHIHYLNPIYYHHHYYY